MTSEGPNQAKSFKRKVLPILLIRTLAFSLGKSDDSQMRKTKIFHVLGKRVLLRRKVLLDHHEHK